MNTFSYKDKLALEELLDMKSGYVLDFSNNSFARFVKDSIGIDIYAGTGYEEYSSKATKLRKIWDNESEIIVKRLTTDLLDYCEDLKLRNNKLSEYDKKKISQLRDVCRVVSEEKTVVPIEVQQSITTTQKVSVFVGSTFEDLQIHRSKVREALDRLKTYVSGMEQFGASPEMPLNKCLSEVSKCQIYVGVFAMRYGSIPHGHEKSFTHLEYECAQKLGLPSLIFIQRQDTPILPKYMDQGESTIKLQELKELLQKNHTCDSFATPDELASKVATAVANQLHDLSNKIVITGNIQEAIQGTTPKSAADIIKLFSIMPVRWQGVKVRGIFKTPAIPLLGGVFVTGLSGDFCEAMNIEYGHGIQMTWIESESARKIGVVASGDLADRLALLSRASDIEAVISPVIVPYYNNFGEEQEEMLYRVEHIISISVCLDSFFEDVSLPSMPPF